MTNDFYIYVLTLYTIMLILVDIYKYISLVIYQISCGAACLKGVGLGAVNPFKKVRFIQNIFIENHFLLNYACLRSTRIFT